MRCENILAAAAAICASTVFALPANAVPINFNITAGTFTPGTGYGVDASELPNDHPTLLDVIFSNGAFSLQNFNLNFVGDSHTFQFGTVNFAEPNGNGAAGINPGEQDNLGLTANFTFVNPLAGIQNVTAAGTAFVNQIDDVQTDYTLAWTPLIVNFGNTGQFQIDLTNLTFTDNGTQNLDATITLLADDSNDQLPVPEPSSMLLLGSGLALTAIRRRRRSKA